ncbi:MAG: hypothetical protein ACRENB_06260 [Gemmatimonadales bacterium]
MHPRLRPSANGLVTLLAAVAACGGDPVGPNNSIQSPSVACASIPPVQLAVGQHVVVDPATTSGCIRVPAAGASGAEYLLVLTSTAGTETQNGVSGTYLLRGSNPSAAGAAVAAAPGLTPPVAGAWSPRGADAQRRFDATLRSIERSLVADPRLRGPQALPPAAPDAVPPPVGDQRTFRVCTNTTCTTFGSVTATAGFVGEHVAIYLDDDVPTNDPLTPADLAELGTAFDTRHYPIDTTAFGRESDIDNNGVVIILMTDAVNALTPDCSDGRVVGYFFGADLLVNFANSNKAEVFYTLVPSPQTSTCSAVTRRQAVNNLKPTLIHELQHMISFNQHSLVRGGQQEETWLNEALSHFAEELGGRLIPNSECTPAFTSCRSQYSGSNIVNLYDFMKEPEDNFLVFPATSGGTLEERGAVWAYLRWVLDQFAADTILGRPTSRQLVETSLQGVANIVQVTGGSFSTMVPQWLMALYLDDQFTEPTGRLRFKSWGFRSIFLDPANQAPGGPFSGFPLIPATTSGSYTRSGTLRAGTGHSLRLLQSASGAAIDLQVRKSNAGDPLDQALAARFGLVRIQ